MRIHIALALTGALLRLAAAEETTSEVSNIVARIREENMASALKEVSIQEEENRQLMHQVRGMINDRERLMAQINALQRRVPSPMTVGSNASDRIILPEIDFRGANIETVVDWLREAAEDALTTTPDVFRAEIRRREDTIKQLQAEIKVLRDYESPKAPPTLKIAIPEDQLSKVDQITCKGRSITLTDAIRAVCESAGLECTVKGESVILGPRRDCGSSNTVPRQGH